MQSHEFYTFAKYKRVKTSVASYGFLANCNKLRLEILIYILLTVLKISNAHVTRDSAFAQTPRESARLSGLSTYRLNARRK